MCYPTINDKVIEIPNLRYFAHYHAAYGSHTKTDELVCPKDSYKLIGIYLCCAAGVQGWPAKVIDVCQVGVCC